jgi:hypothetical protein
MVLELIKISCRGGWVYPCMFRAVVKVFIKTLFDLEAF